MKETKRLVALLLAVVMVLAMTAYGIGSAEASAPEASKYGGRLRIINGGSMSTTSGFPLASGTIENLANYPAIERLCNYDLEGNVVPWLAKEVNIDKENLTIQIILNEGITFSDGEPFNAQTVADVWKITKDNGFTSYLPSVESWEVKSEYEIDVKLSAWSYNLDGNLLVNGGAMFSPKLFNEVGAENMYTNIVGTGPFIMTEYKVGQILSFDRNPNYWAKDADGNQLPYLDGIDIILPADSVSGCNMLRSGDGDCMINMSAMDYSNLKNEGFVPYGENAVMNAGLTGIFFASGNADEDISNVLVRKAFCHAIDTQGIVDATSYGASQLTNQLAVVGSKEYNPDVVGYEYNTEKAAELLKEAGFEPGQCEVTLSYFGNDDTFIIMQANLEAAGFKVVMDKFENAVYGSKILVNGDNLDPYTSTCFWVAPTTADSWFRYFSDAPSTMVKNCLDLKEAGVVDIYNTVRFGTDDAQQKQAMMDLQSKCVDELCLFMPLMTTPSLVLGNDYVMDSGLNAVTIAQWTPATAWLNNK